MQAEPRLAKSAVLEVALQLASQHGWDALHLYDVAREMGVGLDEIHRHYSDKDALAEAWFDVADAALLGLARTPGWEQLPLAQRLHRAIMAWLGSLAPHRRITREMLAYKLQPEHLHLQARGIVRTSQTVQWIREVAMVPAVGWQRELAEAVLTTIFLTVLTHWLVDESPEGRRTELLLERLLRAVGFAAQAIVSPVLRKARLSGVR